MSTSSEAAPADDVAIGRATEALAQFEATADLACLRTAMQALCEVDLLGPRPVQARLALRSQALGRWLRLLALLDAFSQALTEAAWNGSASVQRNKLAWQRDALDQEASEQVRLFVQQYFTPAPVDRAELLQALQDSAVAAVRHAQLLDGG